jgi:hypothetical protein
MAKRLLNNGNMKTTHRLSSRSAVAYQLHGHLSHLPRSLIEAPWLVHGGHSGSIAQLHGHLSHRSASLEAACHSLELRCCHAFIRLRLLLLLLVPRRVHYLTQLPET